MNMNINEYRPAGGWLSHYGTANSRRAKFLGALKVSASVLVILAFYVLVGTLEAV